MAPAPHPFTFPARSANGAPSPIPEAEEPASPAAHLSTTTTASSYPDLDLSHEEQLARFRRSAANLPSSAPSMSISELASPPSRTLVSPTPGSPAPGVTRHHLPSRLTTPHPIPLHASTAPVPVDNFAAPRSDSPHAGVFVPSHKKQDSSISDAWREKSDYHTFATPARGSEDEFGRGTVDGESDVESRHRFTLGDDTYAYNARHLGPGDVRSGSVGKEMGMMDGGGRGAVASMPRGAQGWENEGGRRKRNVKMLWCLIILAIIAIAVGVGVGVSKSNAAKEEDSSAAAASGASSSSSGGESLATADTASSSPTVDALATSVISVTTPSATSLHTSSTRTSASATAAPATYSTSFAYASGRYTTTVPLTYTIPSSYDTRGNGQYQFTEEVVLPSLGTNGGSFTSSLRFRVAATATSTTAAKRKRHVKKGIR
ncbi:hypothetical protein BCR35DRAFT_121076 [Leucosporidium creatinivorum]|uniref:Uncharacterized protein n=1 Tax=Leucosporidium creatinivorum TaxID=106004 RepID=A0A1Y2EZ71_9BASI|nr:hypothetical protein BCR35DRAFT_121076 [Leucosporidium creatinivorum]